MSLTSYRAAPSRDSFVCRIALLLEDCVFVWVASVFYRLEFLDFTRFGSDLLSHALRRSTIGAKALNFRVRDGTGCFALAIATKPRKIQEPAVLGFFWLAVGMVFALANARETAPQLCHEDISKIAGKQSTLTALRK